MSYVIQNFYFPEKKPTINYRIKYWNFLANWGLFIFLYKFYIRPSYNFFSNFFYLSIKIFNKATIPFRTFSFYKLAFYKPLNFSNNFYLSVLYWTLSLTQLFLRNSIKTKNFYLVNQSNPLFWHPLKINTAEVNKNFYDKVAIFYFLNNFFLWNNFIKFFQISQSYLLVQPSFYLNYFFNTLFFPVYNF
jgi:hypothetical protein